MTRFMDVHHGMNGITADELMAAHQADQEIGGEEGVHFERAWADPGRGRLLPVRGALGRRRPARARPRRTPG